MQNIWPSEILETGFPMDITSVFEWFAQESVFAAELTHEPRQREIWIRLAAMWASAAAQCHHVDAGAIGEDAAYLSGAATEATRVRNRGVQPMMRLPR